MLMIFYWCVHQDQDSKRWLQYARSMQMITKSSSALLQKQPKARPRELFFSKKELSYKPAPILLYGDQLPWVTSAKYLGGKMTSMLDGYQQDARCKRAQFIDRNCELIQEFPLAHPLVKCRINAIFNSSFHGSVLWDLTGESTKQLINSWSVAVRHMGH